MERLEHGAYDVPLIVVCLSVDDLGICHNSGQAVEDISKLVFSNADAEVSGERDPFLVAGRAE